MSLTESRSARKGSEFAANAEFLPCKRPRTAEVPAPSDCNKGIPAAAAALREPRPHANLLICWIESRERGERGAVLDQNRRSPHSNNGGPAADPQEAATGFRLHRRSLTYNRSQLREGRPELRAT